MKSPLHTLVLAALGVLAAGAASAAVTVTYTQPEKFSDLSDYQTERARLLEDFNAYFAGLAKRLPADQNLRIEVLDIDLAGQVMPMASTRDLRVMNGGADWPRMRLRYQLEAGGKVLASGEDDLNNMLYMTRLNRYGRNDSLRYEKQMLDEWFDKKIAAPKAG